MDKKKLIFMWASVLLICLVMIFIEIGDNHDRDLQLNQDEMIYLSYDQEPDLMIDPTIAVEPDVLVPMPLNDEIIIIEPDLGRLAVPSVLINKKLKTDIQTVTTDEMTIEQAQQQEDLAYKIFQGQRFSAVLTHAIHSDLPGMVVAEVSQNIYGYQSYIPLLPLGTRLVGNYTNRLNVGDTRLYISWQRAITPDGIDIQLDSIGSDRLGQTGLTGTVDSHFWEIFGTSSLLSVMAVGASNLSEEQGEFSNQYQQGVTDAMMDTSQTLLSERLARKPTIHIPQGAIIHVMVAKDLDFSAALKKTQVIPIF